MSKVSQYASLLGRKIDHDVRSNLSVIQGFCSLLSEQASAGVSPTEFVEDLKVIENAGEGILLSSEWVGNLLRLEYGDWKLEQFELDIAEQVNAIAIRLGRLYPRAVFSIQKEQGAPTLSGDPAVIRSVVGVIMKTLATSVADQAIFHVSIAGQSCPQVSITLGESNEMDSLRVAKALERFSFDQAELNNIGHFDEHYLSVMRGLCCAEIVIDQCTCTISFSNESNQQRH